MKISERRVNGKTDAVLRGCGQIGVVDTMNVLNLYETEDILHANGKLEIGTTAVHDVAVSGEDHQSRA